MSIVRNNITTIALPSISTSKASRASIVSNCCGRELVEWQSNRLSWTYCARCPHKIAPALSTVDEESREGDASS